MGATVVTAKTVAAFRNPKNGEIIYLMFEQTYAKRDHPHTPYWECCAIGTFEQVFERAFTSAAACEGGGLQIRSGTTKPETYLKSWRISFNEPFLMEDLEIELALGGGSVYSTIPDTYVETALVTLTRIGRNDLVEALKSGPIKVSLHRDVDVILALYGVETNLPIRRAIRGLQGLGYADGSLAPALIKRDIASPSVVAFAIDSDNVVVSVDGGPLKHMGWRYSAVQQFIVDVVFPIELQSSFSAYKLIREFRDICNEAPEMPDNATITVTPSTTEYGHYIGVAKKLAVALGLFASVEEVPESYETTFGAVRELKQEYNLSTLQDEQVQWALDPSANAAALPGLLAAGGQIHQQSLF